MRKKINTPPPPPKETRLKVAENTDLMSFLLAKMGGMSRNSIKSLLAHRQVMVNNEITTQFNFALKPNDSVIINSLRGNIELSHPKLKIIFEDQYLIVVEKKEGLLTVSTGKSDETTAFSILKNYVKKSATQNRIFAFKKQKGKSHQKHYGKKINVFHPLFISNQLIGKNNGKIDYNSLYTQNTN